MRHLVLTLTIILSFWFPQPSSAEVEAQVYLNILHTGSSNSLIVFVHGLCGTPDSSFTNDSTGAFWPNLLAEDDRHYFSQEPLSHHTIAVLGYRSTPSHPLSPSQIAGLFGDELLKPEISKRFSNIVFVAHSLGGIVLKTLLNRSGKSRDALIQRTSRMLKKSFCEAVGV